MAMCRLIHNVVAAAMLLCCTALADQAPAVARLGVLLPIGRAPAEAILRQGLSELGYVEGRNLTIDWRRYEQSIAARSAAADLVRSRVDLVVAFGTTGAHAALSATSTIPLVFVSADPIGTGLAASLAHPGANATGISSQSTDLMAKRLELLRQIMPRTRRVILLVNPDNPLYAGVLTEARKAARALRIQVDTLNAGDADQLDTALLGIRRRAGDALIVSSDSVFIVNYKKIADAVRKVKLPTLVPNQNYWGDGVLMSYGTEIEEAERRVAVYIDKILKGAKPGDLPIEQVSKVNLVIDLRVARDLGLTVPQDLLLRADEVIR